MEAFLTKIDRDIEKNIQRDPLKQQVIWTYYANKLYPNINSVTDDIKGFIISALGLHIVENYPHSNTLKNSEKRMLNVMFEMVIIYMLVDYMYEKNNFSLSFIGKDNGKRIYDNEKTKANPIINMRGNVEVHKRILVRQEYLGYIARYRSKAENIKERILQIAFKENDLKDITNIFVNILKRNGEKLKYQDIRPNDKIRNMVINALINTENQKEKYLKVLGLKDNNEKGLNKLFELIIKNDEKKVNEIVQLAIDKENLETELKEKLITIKMVEEFFVPLTNIFYKILDKKNIDDVVKEKDEIKKLKESYKNAMKEIENSTRFEIYKRTRYAIKNNSDEEIVKAIIEDHVEMQKKDNKKPWVELDENGEIKINHCIEKEQIINEWEHNYYIDVARNIYRSISHEEKNERRSLEE